MSSSERQISARMSADPAKANRYGAVTPHAEATSPPSADPITMPPTTPVRVVTESATPRTLGRYTSAYQVTFGIGDIIVPAIVTVALRAGAAALWLPLSAVALLDLTAVGLLAPRMTALTRRVGQGPAGV